MALIGEAKRKILSFSEIFEEQVTNIALYAKFLTDGHSTAHFERLCYKDCPVLELPGRRHKRPKFPNAPVDMNRRALVLKIMVTINEIDATNRSKINIFVVLVELFKLCDSEGIVNIFTLDALNLYTRSLLAKYQQGVKGKSLRQKQAMLKKFLKHFDNVLHEKYCGISLALPNDSQPVEPYSDDELKVIYSYLMKIFKSYSDFIVQNKIPVEFPLFQDLGKQYPPPLKTAVKRRVRGNTNADLWKFDLSRSAYFLACFYTGINSEQLLSLKHEDIAKEPIKEVSRGVFTLQTTKGRQAGQVNRLDVGFGRKAKEFFELWLHISKNLLATDNQFVFPKVCSGIAKKMTVSEASDLNVVLKETSVPPLTSKRFRKTKASIIMRSTESIFMVAEGLNNKAETASKHYADGEQTQMEFSLAAALDIRQKTAAGQALSVAIEETAYKFKDPVREKFLSKTNTVTTSISNGLRCTMPFGEKASQLKKILVQNGLAAENEQVACYKFLDCFSCQYHAVIAEVQDIWLLLSFNDVILQSLIRPSVNSEPTLVLSRVSNTLKVLLDKMAKDFPRIYQQAYEKYLDSPHPLWTDEDDLDLILGVYK
ncbi:MAG: site-specific integrase [Alishewanella aestuarii]